MANWKMKERSRMHSSRGVNREGEFQELDGTHCSSDPTTPSALGSSPAGRRAPCSRSQSMNGRIQKPSFVRSQSFTGSIKSAKLANRSHHMPSDSPELRMQTQFLNQLKAQGANQQQVALAVAKIKDFHLSRSEQQQQLHNPGNLYTYRPIPNLPLELESGHSRGGQHTPGLRLEMEGSAAEPSTGSQILKHDSHFAQLERDRYEDSIQAHKVQSLYPGQNMNHTGHSSLLVPASSSTPSSQNLMPGAPNETFYALDEGTTGQFPLQEMLSIPSRSPVGSANSGNALNTSREPMMGSGDQTSSWSVGNNGLGGGDETGNFLLNYMLRPPNGGRHNNNLNVNAFRKMSLNSAGSARGDTGSLESTGIESMTGLLAAGEKVEAPLMKNNLMKETKSQLASSMDMAKHKFPFPDSLSSANKHSSPNLKLPPRRWGTSNLSLHQEPLYLPKAESSGESYAGSGENLLRSWFDAPGVPLYGRAGQCSEEMYVEEHDLVDTSLHL